MNGVGGRRLPFANSHRTYDRAAAVVRIEPKAEVLLR